MSPCGCYYPRNKIQMALVTDGCASYAIIGYVAVNWGSRDQAKAGYVHVLGNNRVETPESTAGTLATLVASQADQVWYFQGENVCTGKARDEFVVDPQNNNQYYVCGDCDIARTITCTSPQFYDPQCQKCVTRAFPNCDNPVNGGFSQWSNFGTCTKTCGDGQQEQRRTCTNPVPTNGGLSCQNNPAIIDKATSKLIPCNLRTCPQNGGYCSWTNGACNPTCGAGTLTQTRTCACPAPAFGGSDCSLLGPTTNIISCTNGPCPINGGFTAWQNIGGCTKTCGDDGLQRQERTCTNPVAQFGGLTCQENPLIVNKAIVQFIACGRGRCPDVCTNSNTQHNDFYVYPSQTRYCLCTRIDSNSLLTYIDDNVGCVDCPAGASWDPLIDSCSQIQQFQCLADPFCVGKTAGDYSIYHGFANESCSTQYYRCDASLQKQLFSCPINDAGAYFNPVTRTCSTGLAPASCDNHECIGRTDGNKGRLDANCRSYLTCNSFLPTFPICPQGFYYDQGIRRCVEGGSRDNPPAGCIDPDCAGRPAGNYAVDNFCNAFYTCDANQRELSFTSCGSGEYYNPTLSGCSTNYPTGCQHKFCTERSNNVAGIFSFTGSSCSNSYVSCSGTSTAVPNLLTFSLSCPPNQYFRVSNSATSAGSCVNVDGNTPISPLCPNYQCIGRQNGYTFALSTTVAHDCRKYYICNDQQLSEQQCPTASPYYNPNTKTCDSVPSALCWHPDCISGTVPRDYAITANSQCFSSFYRCDANRQRSSQSCGLSFLGGYYGIDAVTNTWRCISGIAPSTCPNYLCIGRTGSASSVSTPMYRNPNDLYCTGYVSCSFSGVQSFLTCPNGGFLDYSGYQCVSARPLDQACRVDGGLSLWGAWQYVAGTSCSAACGNDGVQQMIRTRACNNPAPLNGGSTCGNAALTETKNDVCQTTPPPCGDQFCIGRAAGDYSRTLKDLVNSPNIACFNGYLRCSGAPLNTLEVRTCPSGSIWSPSSTSSNTGACITRPNTLDARCPVCAGIFSGSVPFSTLLTTYDCRSYYSCNNEAHSLVNCPQDTTTFGSNDPRPTYYNPNTKLCERIPVATCSPVQGYWSSWTYAASSSCSVDNNFQCSETQTRLCNSPSPVPSNDPNRQCPGLPTQRVPCRAGASGCGDAFCQSRIAGNYSKTLELSTPTNLGCYKEYITCSGPPSNTKTYEKCILNDQIYFPEKGRCFRDDPDPNCPNVGCAGKADGDHPFSNDLHDCRQFYTCLNEQPTLNTCPTDAQNRSSYYDGFFEKKCVNLPQDLVRRTCNYIQGWWSTWAPAQTCSRNGANQCVRSRTRSCNNPSPKNDPFPCGYSVANLRDESDTIACLESECAQPCQGITCPASSTCVNVGVSYQCQCNAGYQLISGNQLTVVSVQVHTMDLSISVKYMKEACLFA
ncbi:SCO-spondin-like [Clytia hemisphaerica]|uniref:SCO-spondin-like n=1 Tax=Clytia hemisphaerica TaxID=252671 RepID=UPI0034D5EE3E